MRSLAQRQIQKKMQAIRAFKKSASGVPSWIRYMRKALNMTPRQLAERMGIALASLYQLERQEASDKANLQSLKKAAEAMECHLVYAFIPHDPLSEIIHKQAGKRAKELVMLSHLQMEYEDQAVSEKNLKDQIDELMETLKNSKNLWERDRGSD